MSHEDENKKDTLLHLLEVCSVCLETKQDNSSIAWYRLNTKVKVGICEDCATALKNTLLLDEHIQHVEGLEHE